MNLNGQVLKLSFLIIVISLCIVLVVSTLDFMTGKMTIDSYKGLLEILGIPTLIGVIVQSFLHSNIQDKATAASAAATNPHVPVAPLDNQKVD